MVSGLLFIVSRGQLLILEPPQSRISNQKSINQKSAMPYTLYLTPHALNLIPPETSNLQPATST